MALIPKELNDSCFAGLSNECQKTLNTSIKTGEKFSDESMQLIDIIRQSSITPNLNWKRTSEALGIVGGLTLFFLPFPHVTNDSF